MSDETETEYKHRMKMYLLWGIASVAAVLQVLVLLGFAIWKATR